MKNGLYKVAFATPLGEGTGVVVLNDGKISGGDMAMYYTGSFSLDGTHFTSQVLVDRHTAMPGTPNVFGTDRVHIDLQGEATEESAKCNGSSPDAPGISFNADLTRICD